MEEKKQYDRIFARGWSAAVKERFGIDTTKLLREVARRCGWRSERVMSHVFERQLGCSVAVWLKSELKEL